MSEKKQGKRSRPASLGAMTQGESRIFYAYDLVRLRPAIKPFRLHWYPVLRSTNDHAADLRAAGKLYAPSVVLTGHQKAGRGRGANTWWSRPGCITATFVFPIDDQVQPHQIPLLAGLGVRNAVAEITGIDDIQLKWPNDVLYKGQKLAGLLCERKEKADLVGIGLNVNLKPEWIPEDLADRITAMSIITPGELYNLADVLATVTKHVRALVTHQAERPFGSVLREY